MCHCQNFDYRPLEDGHSSIGMDFYADYKESLLRRPYHNHVLTMAAMAQTTQMCCVFRWCGQRWWRNNLPCLGRPPERFPVYGGTPKFPVIIHLQMGFSIIHPSGSTPIYGPPHIFSKKHEQIQLISNEQVYNLYNWLGTALRGTWWF